MNYSSDMKESKEYRLAKTFLYNLVLSIFITIALGVISVFIFDLRLDVVLSDSMAPKFYKDDIVIIKEFKEYEEKDIVEYQISKYSKPVTHRIVSKTGTGKDAVYLTKGDNADGIDEITIDQINGKVIEVVEDGNLIYQFIKRNYFLFIDILLGVWVLSSTLSNEKEMRGHNIANV